VSGLVEIRRDVRLEDWQQLLDERRPARHPLEVAPPAVVIRPVEPRARDARFEPAQQRFVTDVHLERDVGLTAVAAEAALAHQQPDDHALIALAQHGGIVSPGRKT
jgi:hypothetical protein